MIVDTVDKWFAVDVYCRSEAVEAVEDALNELESLGIETDLLAKKKGEPIRVTAYFNELPTAEIVDASLGETDFLRVETREIADTDWLAEWKKHWRAVEIGKFVIAPPWEPLETNKIVIRIEPNMAFGTGTHATTQLCLAAISTHYRAGESFLDVGCGTGILSIAAAKMNEAEQTPPAIFGCDTDEKSVEIARENAVLNAVSTLTNFSIGSIGDDTPRFGFTCANVTLDVILPMLGLLLEKTTRTLVLSGILVDQKEEIENALDDRGASYEIAQSGEWISVTIAV